VTLADLRNWLSNAPADTTLRADSMLALLNDIPNPPTLIMPSPETIPTWRERLWITHPDTRIGTVELAEALGRPRSWIYRHTGPRSPCAPIPHRKLDGELVFLVGEVRQWVEEREAVVVQCRSRTDARKRSAMA